MKKSLLKNVLRLNWNCFKEETKKEKSKQPS